MDIFLACLSENHMFAKVLEVRKGSIIILDLDLQIDASSHVGDGDLTVVL